MRAMVNDFGRKINVVEHLILNNGWEYYVTDDKFDENTALCVVMGFEVEMGDVYLPSVEPYVISRKTVTRNTNLLPAIGWKWE